MNAAGERRTECAVAVANQVTRRFVPGKRVRHLTCGPHSPVSFPFERQKALTFRSSFIFILRIVGSAYVWLASQRVSVHLDMYYL